MEAVARTFRPLWRTRECFHISNAGNNILLFDFDVEVDADKVLLSEPWSYDRHLYMTEETAREIGDTIGLVIKPSDDSEWKGGTFLRVRVRVDMTHPLCPGRKVTFEEGQERSRSIEVKGFESRQTSPQGAREGNEDKAVKQRAQISEVVASGGGEVERTEVATEEDLNLPEPSLAAGFRGGWYGE
uniref:DUF4283 domain-containing protein n=1 Tax=Quercus lobata TaxID=97700 RepID=A0A7N2MLC6_QUELO